MKIKHIIRYFVKYYPYKNELSKTRLTKMVYLADWYNTLKYGKQLTDINWYFDHFGPYVIDVYNTVKADRKLQVNKGYTRYGSPKETITMNDNHLEDLTQEKLNPNITEILDQVIENTKSMYWHEFIDYIYSSYPIKNSKRYKKLDLERLASECKEQEIYY